MILLLVSLGVLWGWLIGDPDVNGLPTWLVGVLFFFQLISVGHTIGKHNQAVRELNRRSRGVR